MKRTDCSWVRRLRLPQWTQGGGGSRQSWDPVFLTLFPFAARMGGQSLIRVKTQVSLQYLKESTWKIITRLSVEENICLGSILYWKLPMLLAQTWFLLKKYFDHYYLIMHCITWLLLFLQAKIDKLKILVTFKLCRLFAKHKGFFSVFSVFLFLFFKFFKTF